MLCPKQPIRIEEGICGNRLSCLCHNLPIAPVSNVLMRLDCHLNDLRILSGHQIWENIHSESDFFVQPGNYHCEKPYFCSASHSYFDKLHVALEKI